MYPEPFQSPKDNNTQTQANSGTFQHPQAYNTQTPLNTGQFQLSSFGDLYPYSQMPPPPPPTKKNKHAFLWVVFGLLLVLILASTSFIGVQQYERSSGNARTAAPTTLPAQATTAVQPTAQPIWWSQKSRQFLVENKTKHNHSRKLVLSARIDLRWRLIVQRLMKPLVIVKREIRSQVAHRVCHALVIFDVHLLVFDTAP